MSNDVQKEFFETFGKEHEDVIERLIMAQIYGNEETLNSIGLKYLQGKSELWGLFVIGKKLHFYAPESESAMSFLFRASTGGDKPKSQYALLSNLERFEANFPKKQGFFSLLISHPDLVLDVKAFDGEMGNLYVKLNEKSKEAIELLNRFKK